MRGRRGGCSSAMSNITLIIVIVPAVLGIVSILIAGYQMARMRRTTQLRERYGPEYDRAVDLAASQHEAESELRGVPSGMKSWGCAVSTRLSVSTSSGVGQTYRANSWTTQASRCATPTCWSWR